MTTFAHGSEGFLENLFFSHVSTSLIFFTCGFKLSVLVVVVLDALTIENEAAVL